MRFTTVVAREMAKRGLSERDLANLAGLKEEKIHFLLRGSLKTDLRTIAAVSLALGFRATFEFMPVSVLDKMIEDPTDGSNEAELRRTIRL